ncbi:chorismate mutase [Clostridium hydrogeniformans]|uniref:chorismate mutase n=1 Tax=Clostridium hydrogeniformans TaxID=349933 RepID=UPI000481155C|nr:chorismate mutase [Clostridium hydrogeniformans]
MVAIRGAITIAENTIDEIKSNSIFMMDEIIKKNNLNIKDISSIIFSCTDDIDKDYPGKFIREHFNINNAAIMHFNEMKVKNSSYLSKCIRVTVFYNESLDNIYHVYLKKAKDLRKDLCYNEQEHL